MYKLSNVTLVNPDPYTRIWKSRGIFTPMNSRWLNSPKWVSVASNGWVEWIPNYNGSDWCWPVNGNSYLCPQALTSPTNSVPPTLPSPSLGPLV